jgi:hyperpolarization activated cyclic nucleotide-gated potassium channel 2
MPLSLGWEQINNDFYWLNLLVDILFMMDVGKNFFTGYVDENESIVMSHKLVVINYLTGYFLIDFLSSFPLDPLLDAMASDSEQTTTSSSASEVTRATKTLKMLKLLRMAKLFRLMRLSRVFRYFKMGLMYMEEKLHVRVSDGFTKLIKLMTGVLLVCHWIGSFNFMIARLADFPEDSWVVFADLQDETPSVQWQWSFFKAMCQMIMIGFDTPTFTNTSCTVRSEWCGTEHWITLVCLYIGAVFYSLLISSVASILNSANMSSRYFEEKLGKLDDYMRSQKLPAPLREKVKDYFHLQHSDGKIFDEMEILSSVTPILRREIIAYKNREILIKVPLLQETDENRIFAAEVAVKLKPMIVFIDEVIMRENTTGSDIYFIYSGVIEIFLKEASNITYVAIGDGCYFGEVAMLMNCKRTASARTKTQCLLYHVAAEDFRDLLEDFPDREEYVCRVAKSRQRRIVQYLSGDDKTGAGGDDLDEEDAKTDLFGADADEMMSVKDREADKNRTNARISRQAASRYTSNPKNFSSVMGSSVKASKFETEIEQIRNRPEMQQLKQNRSDKEHSEGSFRERGKGGQGTQGGGAQEI